MLSLTIHVEAVLDAYQLRVSVRDLDRPMTEPVLMRRTYTLLLSTPPDDHDELGTLLCITSQWAEQMTHPSIVRPTE